MGFPGLFISLHQSQTLSILVAVGDPAGCSGLPVAREQGVGLARAWGSTVPGLQCQE